MQLFFDQNISFRILSKIEEAFPDSRHVKTDNLIDATDHRLWHHCRDNGYCVVTFDADFIDLLNLHGPPPPVIRIRSAGISTRNLAALLLQKQDVIRGFLSGESGMPPEVLEIFG
ncbi:MAG: DUF5615 family PIN-like protein [Candidatus Cyclonatronum sp.]|uniref:DUF5615 family PIN-like protein n=1 Tax=Cyclonatronum sp. TaxID=3024185 RepID=UPI0025BFB211|nr:DUF5615 family PIN-like protein [Cyclonatronum sp.]MCC5934385.1 DUF5615 family PIN-like protein [Balneolales bacterium]MCH8486137.1 DUF5615 family PIN-like protein [Cyclonatronum sp.]